jgi:hypothetical protein
MPPVGFFAGLMFKTSRRRHQSVGLYYRSGPIFNSASIVTAV